MGSRAHLRAWPGRRVPRTPSVAGFTLIELLVVLAVLALLASVVAPRYLGQVDRAKEDVLRHNLQATRTAIDQFRGDTGRYPESLQELVAQRYLKSLPMDPLLGRVDAWVLSTPPNEGAAAARGIADIRSSAPGPAHDRSRYANW